VALDELVDTFFPALDAIGGRVVEVEEAVLAGDTDVQAQIFAIRKELIAVRRVVGPMRDAMVVLLRRDLGIFGSESQRYLAIFAVVTMISGIYGMNLHHMPELGWRYGYAWAVGLMVATAGALWVYFKRKGWLWRIRGWTTRWPGCEPGWPSASRPTWSGSAGISACRR
jgi:magnesium transporter